MDEGFIKYGRAILKALPQQRLSGLQHDVINYVMLKTVGFGKVHDYIAITKMADDLGRYRQDVSGAVRDLEAKGILKVTRMKGNRGHEMQVQDPKHWDQGVGKTRHVGKSLHVGKTRQEASGNPDTCRRKIPTHNRYIYRYSYRENPLNPPYEDEGDIDRSDYTEEEIEQLRKEGWII